jgi:hypothetical protein
MNTSGFKSLVRVMFVVFALVAVAGVALISRGQGARSKLPKGNWTFSAGPQVGVGYRSMPIDVFRVKTKAAQGLTVESVSLFNRSFQDVKEVKLHWYLKEKSQKQTLAEGDTAFFDVALPAGDRLVIDYPVVSFDRLYQPLMRGGVLSGEYRIEVVVNAITFVDGSKWTPRNPGEVKLAHAVSRRVDGGCQNSGCFWSGPSESYFCGSNDGSSCLAGGHGDGVFCMETRCPGLDD